jgi:photosystem II stability/assembly factor-like uncharacterized protein
VTEPPGRRLGVRPLTRKRVVAAVAVAAFVGVFAAIGAVSRSSPTTPVAEAPATASDAAGTAPSAGWYWTMAVSPSDPSVLVLGTSNGLYRSTDGGKTWQPTGPKGLESTSLAHSGSSIFVGGVEVAAEASPVVRTASGRTAPSGHAVLAASTDGGETWQVLHPLGLPDISVQALAADPANGETLYALLNTGRLYRSTDGARRFQLVSPKTEKTPWAIAVTQHDRLVAGDMDTGSYLSANGKAWEHTDFTDSVGGKMVMEYAVEPTDPARLLMSSYGVELSTDGGKTWHVALKSSVMFGPVAWAPSASSVAYAVGFDGSVWRSSDSGTSWTKVS